MADKDIFMIIDGNSLVYREFYGLQASYMKAADGTPTGAVVGFINKYMDLCEKLHPKYVAVAFDLKGPTFRHKMYEEYKAGRAAQPDDLRVQMPIVRELLTTMGVHVATLEGYEGDDILGTLSARFSNEGDGVKPVIVTGDRDSLQLISGQTKVLLLTNKGDVLYDEDLVKTNFGVMPIQMIEMKGLMGDSSDNIPGVPGVGPKTATALIETYGTLDEIYAHVDEISQKSLKQKLIDNKELAFLSRTLGTICTDAPYECELSNFEPSCADMTHLSEMIDRLEFRKMGRKLLAFVSGSDIVGDTRKNEVEVPLFEDDAEEGDGELSLFNFTAEESETYGDSEKFYENKPNHLYILTKELEPLDMTILSDKYDEPIKATEITDTLRAWLEDENIQKSFFKAKPFVLYSLKHGIKVRGVHVDLSIAAYLLDSTRKVDELASVLRFIEDKNVPSIVKSLPSAVSHALSKLEACGMTKLYSEIEMPLATVLAEMEEQGFLVDASILKESGYQMRARIAQLEQQIYDLAGTKFNINSPAQLGEVLFDTLGLEGGKKTKTKKAYSTNAEVLEKIAGDHPIVPLILEYRQNAKLVSTYIDGLLALANKSDGRIHTTFQQTVTATGRLSSTEPNLQNIPVRSTLGREIRKAFVPSPGCVLIDADYSQIELRILAALSGDNNMVDAFISGEDIHAITASKVNHVPLDMVTKEMRSRAKAVNFGIVYGISEFGLAGDLGISRFEALRYIENYFREYPGVQGFLGDLVESAKEKGYAETIFGRRRAIPELTAAKVPLRQFGERVAKNMPIQGTAADIIKIAMIRTRDALAKAGLKARLILQVHDELLIDAPVGEQDQVLSLLRESMEDAYRLAVPLKVETSVSGESWFYCK